MAYKSNPGSAYGCSAGGNEDYFADAPESKGEERSTPEHDEQDEEQGETAILPKSILGGKEFKPGDEVVLKITAMHDDSVEVSYASEKGEEKGQEEMAEAPPPGEGAGGDHEMQSMME